MNKVQRESNKLKVLICMGIPISQINYTKYNHNRNNIPLGHLKRPWKYSKTFLLTKRDML